MDDQSADVHNTSEVLSHLCANTDPERDCMVAVRKDSPKARLTTTPPAKSPAAASWALMRRRNCRAKVSNAPGHPLITMDKSVKAKVEKLFKSMADVPRFAR